MRNLTSQQIRVLFYAIREKEERFFRRWEKILGTHWDYNDIFPPVDVDGPASEPPSFIRYPLALAIRGDLLKALKQSPISPPGGKYSIPESGVIEGADLSRDEFLRIMSMTSKASEDVHQQLKREREEREVALRQAGMEDAHSVSSPMKPRVPPELCPSCIRMKRRCPVHQENTGR